MEKSLLVELWEYFTEKYFTVDLPYLENLSLGSGSLISLGGVIIGIAIGNVIAAICTVYNKRYIGDFVRKLIYEECFDAGSAKTLYELGYLKSAGIRGVIKSGGSLSRWVRCVEEDDFLSELEKSRQAFDEEHKNDIKKPKFKEIEFKRDLNTMHFYLPRDKKYAAEIKFDDKGASWGAVILVIIGAVLFAAFACYMLPDILKLIDNFISVMK